MRIIYKLLFQSKILSPPFVSLPPSQSQISPIRRRGRVRAAAAISRDAQELLTTVLVTVIHDSVTLFTCVWHLRLPNDSLAECVILPPEYLS